MADITLFELHPDGDVQVGPRSLPGSTPEPTTDEPMTDEGGGSKLSLLLGLAFLAFLVYAAMKVLSEEPDQELDELDS